MAGIQIKGIAELNQKLGKAASYKVLQDPMQRSVMALQRDMADYPAQRSSSYVRTGTLGRRWTTKVSRSGSGLTGTVGNNTQYAPWVQSHQFQAGVHRGRWQTDDQVVKRNLKSIVDWFQRAIDEALR